MQGKVLDLTGQKFGRLTVVGREGSNKHRQSLWLCECECGNLITVPNQSLIRGATKSCGCWKREFNKASHYRHGASNTTIHNIWVCMRERCNKPNYKAYKNYGGRGIKVCDEWNNDFQAFYNDISMLPHFGEDGYSLDRIDNDGDYEPNNVRWANRRTQQNNTRANVRITYNGETLTIGEWAEKLGINYNKLYGRLRNGWDIEKAFTTK